MKNMIRLGAAYLRYYKKQTMTLFFGIVLSAALLTGIGSLFGSGKHAAMENARTEYGDWHYSTRCDYPWFEEFKKNLRGSGYKVEEYGVETVRKVIEEPYSIEMASADEGYLDMMNRELKAGRFPQADNEIVMDTYTLRNLNVPEELGSAVTLDGEIFTLCGIVTDGPKNLSQDCMEVFVNSTLDYGTNGSFLYIKFNEAHKVSGQIEAAADKFHIGAGKIARNNGLSDYVGGESAATLWEVIKTGLQSKDTGLPFIWTQLNSNGILTEKVILAALAIFGAFIIYSLFQISVIKRMSQYSVMQTLGMSDGVTFGTLMTEMCMIFAVAYPVGCVVGNKAASLIYRKAGRIFILQESVPQHTGAAARESLLESAASRLPAAGSFSIDWDVIVGGAVFLVLFLLFISHLLVRQMKKLTIRQMIAKDTGKRQGRRKIYSINHQNLTGILTNKFMFSRKGAFVGILLSLSVGSIIFLGAAYVTENTKTNNNLVFKADDGLGSDVQVYESSDLLTDVIPEKKAGELAKISELESVHPVRYMLGEVPFNDGSFKWTTYYDELADDETRPPDPQIVEKYGGAAVKTGEDDYSIKVNIYGYDDDMLRDLKDYVLEGSIDPEQMRRDNSVIFKTLMDGQGNYNGIDIKPDDTVQIKTWKNRSVPQEALRFQGTQEWYQSREMKISALASRPLAKVDTFIGDRGDNSVDIIMTNEQMEENFGLSDYQTISISLKEGVDAQKAADKIQETVSEIQKCVVKDYTQQIESQNFYLTQKMMFFYGIAAVILGISLLHIMNSMQYLITARKHEFGIMRAMGITDAGFCGMLAKEGLRYGIYSSIVMASIYFIIQKILYYFMAHIYLYINPKPFVSPVPLAGMIVSNLVICVTAVLLSGRMVLKQQVADEIKGWYNK